MAYKPAGRPGFIATGKRRYVSGGIETTLGGGVKGKTRQIIQSTEKSKSVKQPQSIGVLRSSSALPSTHTSDKAIAAAAISGLSSPTAASGIAKTL